MRKKNRVSVGGWKGMGVAVAAWSGVLALGGCLSVPIPQAEADPSRFYVLNSTAVAGVAGASVGGTAERPEAERPPIRLLPVEVASYLRSRTMVVRRGENEIQFREFARWGEPLDLGVARVLREELLARGAASQVLAGGVAAPSRGDGYTLTVRVLACEGGADGSVFFRAIWELGSTGPNAATVARGDFRPTDLRWDGKNEASLAAQLSVAVVRLAEEIAGALRK